MDTSSSPRLLVLQTLFELCQNHYFKPRAFHSLHILSNPGSRKGIGAGGIFIIGCRSHIKGDVESATLFSQHSTRTLILLGTRENHLLKFWTNKVHVVIILNTKICLVKVKNKDKPFRQSRRCWCEALAFGSSPRPPLPSGCFAGAPKRHNLGIFWAMVLLEKSKNWHYVLRGTLWQREFSLPPVFDSF